jgi:hypothetical protein
MGRLLELKPSRQETRFANIVAGAQNGAEAPKNAETSLQTVNNVG